MSSMGSYLAKSLTIFWFSGTPCSGFCLWLPS